MGKTSRRFNWKARQQHEVSIDNSQISKIRVDLNTADQYDEANPLVLPSAKRKTKQVKKSNQSSRILSKKQRKRLEKILEKKKKKIEGASLLKSLEEVTATGEDLNHLIPIAAARTQGRKRMLNEFLNAAGPKSLPTKSECSLNSISGSKRQKRIMSAILNKRKSTKSSGDVVGFDPSSSDEDAQEEPDEVDTDVSKMANVHKETLDPSNDVSPNLKFDLARSSLTDQPEIKKVNVKVEQYAEPKKLQKSVWIPVSRSPLIEEARNKLPIIAEEQPIMEAIEANDVIIIAGETGSGKTTQVPQFLYEAGFARNGIIGVTQPRRVAAVTMSKRVAEELNLTSDEVSYLIRFEGNVTEQTKIKFMTDGVLLKEVQSDFLLLKYSAVILDEAHERSTHTDILIGLLSRIVPVRRRRAQPLKLIIMSATLRIEDFTTNTRLFKSPPPVMSVDSRQYPVSVHFSRRTEDDYLKEAFRKVCKIHNTLPDGGILVFLTGQQEVNTLVRRLRSAFPASDQLQDPSEIQPKRSRRARKSAMVSLPSVDLDKYSVVPMDDTEADLVEEHDSDDEDDALYDEVSGGSGQPLWVLPFYSLLPQQQQTKVFMAPPTGYRLCIVSTNIAETSLTIPNVKYVVDSGRTKSRLYDKLTGVSTFLVTWCSKASANQRAGRAGRVGPGHCYRLYSSAIFNDMFQQFSMPEINEKPVDSLVLQMKSMNIVKVVNFPFPTPPDIIQLKSTERRLQLLQAIETPSGNNNWCGKLTALGRTMASFPVMPRYGKMLALSEQHGLLPYVVCLVAALSVPELLVESDGNRQWAVARRAWAGTANSFLLGDLMVLLRAVGAAECATEPLEQFCAKNGLRHKAIKEVRKLRVQLTNQINLNVPEINLVVDPKMSPPTDPQVKLIRQIVLAGMADQVAHKVDISNIKDNEEKLKWRRAYKCSELEDPVFIRTSSVLSKDLPEWVVYQEVYETNKLYMRGVTAIEPEWLPVFASGLCHLSEPVPDPPPRFDTLSGKVLASVSATFGRAGFELPVTEVPYTTGLGSYKWFAKMLLEGLVFPKLARFTPSLLSAPSSMVKSWAKLQPRTETLLKSLVSKECNTRQKLIDAWHEAPLYLLSAYQSWLPESAHGDLAAIWPPTDS